MKQLTNHPNHLSFLKLSYTVVMFDNSNNNSCFICRASLQGLTEHSRHLTHV